MSSCFFYIERKVYGQSASDGEGFAFCPVIDVGVARINNRMEVEKLAKKLKSKGKGVKPK